MPRAPILILPACVLIGLGLATILNQRDPNRYDALVTLEVLDWKMKMELWPPTFNPLSPTFKVITSKATLYRVVDALKLDETWGVTRKEAYTRLRNNTDTRKVQDTDLTVIEYRDTDVALAATVANKIASAYIDRRETLEGYWNNKLQQQYTLQLRGFLDSGLGQKHPQVLEVQGQLDKSNEMLARVLTWASPGTNSIRETWTPSLWGAGIGLLAGLLLLIALGRRTACPTCEG